MAFYFYSAQIFLQNKNSVHKHTYWVVQQSWFAIVNALCNLSCKKSQKVIAATSGPISEQVLVHAVYDNGSWT